MELKYKRDNAIKTVLIDYENHTDICYERGQNDHKFDNCLFFPKSFSIKVEKKPSGSLGSKETFIANSIYNKNGYSRGLENRYYRRRSKCLQW